MNHNLQPGAHLDADQLTAFAEGALPEHERLLVLAHTAGCARCRETAFLAQDPAPVEAPAAERTPWWRAWSQPWMLGGATALAASALVLGVYLRTRPGPPRTDRITVARSERAELAAKQQPEPPAPEQKPEQSPDAKRSVPAQAGVTTSPLGETKRPEPQIAVQSLQPAAKSLAVQPVAAPTLTAAVPTVAMAPAPAMMAKASPPPPNPRMAMQDKAMSAAAPPAAAGQGTPQASEANAAATVRSAQVQNLPMNNRSLTSLRAAAAPARVVPSGPLHLQIEHGAGSEGFARLTGAVLDATGAAIPNAVVKLSQLAPATTAQTTTDIAGRFSLPPVPAGEYQAQVSAPGFAMVTQKVDLMARDVAQVDAVLPVGSASQTVEVSTANAVVTNAEVTTLAGVRDPNALPSGLPIATLVSRGDRSVALDTAGAVFVRRGGKHWKRVKRRWDGNIAKLEAGASVFQITTERGSVWVSADGEHWVRQ